MNSRFDPDGAKALLDEAGYGPFSIDFFVTPDLPTIVNPQTGEAIAQMWQDNLGITVNIDSTAYSAKRPSLVDRSFIGAYIWTYGSPSPGHAAALCSTAFGGRMEPRR